VIAFGDRRSRTASAIRSPSATRRGRGAARPAPRRRPRSSSVPAPTSTTARRARRRSPARPTIIHRAESPRPPTSAGGCGRRPARAPASASAARGDSTDHACGATRGGVRTVTAWPRRARRIVLRGGRV